VTTGSGRTLWLDPGDEAGFLEYTGESAKAAVERAMEIRDRVLDSCRCILQLSASGKKGAITATEILEVAAPMYERADELRDVYGTPMEALFNLYIRLVRAKPGDLEPCLRASKDLPMPKDGLVEATWDPWFQEGVEAQAKRVSMFAEGKRDGIVSTRTAVEALQSVTGVEDVDEELERLAEDQERTAGSLLDAAAKRFGQPAQGDGTGTPGQEGADATMGVQEDGQQVPANGGDGGKPMDGAPDGEAAAD
jgi:hypothetical protein